MKTHIYTHAQKCSVYMYKHRERGEANIVMLTFQGIWGQGIQAFFELFLQLILKSEIIFTQKLKKIRNKKA